MKIKNQLWLVFSILFIAFSVAVYLVLSNAYEQRLQEGYEQVSIARGSAILDVLTEIYPDSPKRSTSYLRNYGEELNARLIILNENKKVFADSFEQLEANTTLDIAVLAQSNGYASHFVQTDAFGYVQYTLLPFESIQRNGYLLMIQEAGSLYSELSSFRYWMIQAILISLLTFSVLSYVVSTWLTKPIRRIIAALRKITPRKRTFSLEYSRQDEVKELVDAIQGMVDELNLYDERQRRFLSTSSHELKTPLATMQLILENLPHVRENEEKYLEFAQDLSFQVQKMKQMVEQLLQITRLWSKDKPLQKEIISEQDIRDHILQSFQYLARDKQVPFKFELEKTNFHVDRVLFFRALDNLVSNAVRYSQQGKAVTIKIKNGKKRSVVSVCDEGIGIAPEDLPHIFDPFYRSNEATAWNQEGSGLGLAIVKQIAEIHKGEITIETVPMQGTCAHLSLPDSK